MDIRQLRYFVTVAEEANFTRAAARLHLAQPGVSAQVRQLEKELGHLLLDRSGRSVTLTEVGEAVLPYARAAIGAVEAVRQTADEFTGLLRGQVTLGLVAGAAAAAHEFDLASVLARFHADHPQVEIALTEETSEWMLTALRQGELDMAMIGLAEAQPAPGISLQVLVDEPLVAAVAPDDPALTSPDRTSIPLAELRDRPLISLPRGTGIRGYSTARARRPGSGPASPSRRRLHCSLPNSPPGASAWPWFRHCPPTWCRPSGCGRWRSPSRGYAAGSRSPGGRTAPPAPRLPSSWSCCVRPSPCRGPADRSKSDGGRRRHARLKADRPGDGPAPRAQHPGRDPLPCAAYPENVRGGERDGTVLVL